MTRDATIAQAVRGILETAGGNILKPAGFIRRGDVFTRPADGLTHLIEVQHSRWSDANEVRFTLNCGIHIPQVTSTFRNKPEPNAIELTDCCVNARFGMLRESHVDTWWKFTKHDLALPVQHFATEVSSAIAETIIPFLDRFGNARSVAKFLSEARRPLDEYIEPRASSMALAYAALVYARLGNDVECERCVAAAMKNAKGTPLEQVVAAFAARKHC